MFLISQSKNKKALFIIFGAILLVGAGIYAYTSNPKAEPLEQQNPTGSEVRTDALRSFVDTMNKASGIESGVTFNYVSNGIGNATNFGIVRCVDEIRCDLVVRNEVAKFQQSNNPSPDLAEVDMKRSWVVSVHRAIPSYEIKGELPSAEIERIAHEFLITVYPEFSDIESNLTFSPGMKGARLNNGNYFFRWNDERYAVPDGLAMDLPPFLQVGVSAGGFIFSYTNTIPLYREPLRDDLRKLCAYVEMPFSDDSAIDTENGIVTVWYMDERGDNRYLLLPYEPRTDFEGCSESAKEKLEHIREVDDRNRASGFYD